MEQELLKVHPTWNALYKGIEFDRFVKEKIPKIRLFKEVSGDVIESFKIIHRLLVHSYFEYLFLDIAVLKSFQTFEMALKIRYREQNGGKEWKDNAPLNQLLEWFNKKNYFEIDQPEFFEHVRKTRNYLVHPKGHHFGGTASMHWVATSIDLINDLYDSIPLRKERREAMKVLAVDLSKFAEHGCKLIHNQDKIIFYGAGPVSVNNTMSPTLCYISLLPIFDEHSVELKQPTLISAPLMEIKLQNDTIRLHAVNGDELELTTKLNDKERDTVSEFKDQIVRDQHLSNLHKGMLFQASKQLQERWRDERRLSGGNS